MKTRDLLTIILIVGAAFIAACGGSETNVNVRPANTVTSANVTRASPAPTVDCKNVNMSRGDYDKNRAECEKEKGTSTIGQGADDSWIWFKTRAALLAASDLRESTINVDVNKNVIALKGTVANAAQKASAEKVAKSIEGQKGVKNELKVAPNDSITNMKSNNNSGSGSNMNANKMMPKK